MANTGIALVVGIILFNILMYAVVYEANADTTIGSAVGSGIGVAGTVNACTANDISMTQDTSWISGFNVSVFNMPWWVNIFYVTFQFMLLTLGIYAMIRGLS